MFTNHGRTAARDIRIRGTIMLELDQWFPLLQQVRWDIDAPALHPFSVYPGTPFDLTISWPLGQQRTRQCIAEDRKLEPVLACSIDYRFPFGADKLCIMYQICWVINDDPVLMRPSAGDVPKEQLRLVQLPPKNTAFSGV